MVASLVASWDATRARVTLTAAGLNAATDSTRIDRYDRLPTVDAHVVRGSDLGASTSGIVHDDEFTDSVINYYYLTSFNAAGAVLDAAVYGGPVTPALTTVWLKSVIRPFLNRAVTVTDFSEVTSPARGGVYEVLGRRLPVAVTEVRGSRRYALTLTAADEDEAEALDLFFTFGDVVLLQVPAGCVVPRTMYAFVGDLSVSRRGKHDTARRYFDLPLVECAGPDPSISGSTVTWAGVVAAYATWADVLAAHSTWLDLMTSVSDPVDEIVS